MVNAHTFYAIAVMAIITALLRFLPFLIFKGKASTPPIVEKLGRLLPSAVIAMLVVYCLKSVPYGTFADGAKQLLAGAVVVIVHLAKRNTLLSIAVGTAAYMLLIRL